MEDSTPRNGIAVGGASQVPKWESFKRRLQFRLTRFAANIVYNPLVKWWYFHGGLRKYDEPGDLFLKRNLFWFCNGTWSHICGSDDIAMEYFIRTFAPNYKSKKWA